MIGVRSSFFKVQRRVFSCLEERDSAFFSRTAQKASTSWEMKSFLVRSLLEARLKCVSSSRSFLFVGYYGHRTSVQRLSGFARAVSFTCMLRGYANELSANPAHPAHPAYLMKMPSPSVILWIVEEAPDKIDRTAHFSWKIAVSIWPALLRCPLCKIVPGGHRSKVWSLPL